MIWPFPRADFFSFRRRFECGCTSCLWESDWGNARSLKHWCSGVQWPGVSAETLDSMGPFTPANLHANVQDTGVCSFSGIRGTDSDLKPLTEFFAPFVSMRTQLQYHSDLLERMMDRCIHNTCSCRTPKKSAQHIPFHVPSCLCAISLKNTCPSQSQAPVTQVKIDLQSPKKGALYSLILTLAWHWRINDIKALLAAFLSFSGC